jgi:YfiH family protein
MTLMIPHWADLPDQAGACMTVRSGGVSVGPYDDGAGGGGLNLGAHVGDDPVHVAANRALLGRILPSSPVWLNQVHGVNVVDAAAVLPGTVCDADASVTDVPGVVCAVMTADCLPVLFCDVAGKVVGAAHAGWRGLAAGVLEATIDAMRAKGAGVITAWMGAAIGPAQFEVGTEVRDVFVADNAHAAQAFVPVGDASGKYLADIYLLARLRLQRHGVTHIAGGGLCTVSQTAQFYSYRRDKTTGRMASLIWLK